MDLVKLLPCVHRPALQVAEMAVTIFISGDRPNVAGLVLAGSADFKTELSQSDMFDQRLQAAVLAVVDVSYGAPLLGLPPKGFACRQLLGSRSSLPNLAERSMDQAPCPCVLRGRVSACSPRQAACTSSRRRRERV